MTRRWIRLVLGYLLVAGGVTAGWAYAGWHTRSAIGLTQTVSQDEGVNPAPSPSHRTVTSIDLSILNERPEIRQQPFVLRWDGYWLRDEDGAIDVRARADGRVTVWIDDTQVLTRRMSTRSTAEASVTLARGIHKIAIEYGQSRRGRRLTVLWAPPGQPGKAIEPHELFIARPSATTVLLARAARSLRPVLPVVWLAPPVVALLFVGVRAVNRWRGSRRGARRDSV